MKTSSFALANLPTAMLMSALAACGGGGDDSTQPTSAAAVAPGFPVEATLTSLVSASSTFHTSATDASGASYSLTFTLTPGPDELNTAISPSPQKTSAQASILEKNGVMASSATEDIYYSVAPFLVWGSLSGSGGTMLVNQQTHLPVMANVGMGGAVYSGYINTSYSAAFPAQQDVTWTLEADTSTTAWLCLNTTITQSLAASSPAISIEADCFRIDETGVVSGFKADVTQGGITLHYR
jgi:hypothetical protein